MRFINTEMKTERDSWKEAGEKRLVCGEGQTVLRGAVG